MPELGVVVTPDPPPEQVLRDLSRAPPETYGSALKAVLRIPTLTLTLTQTQNPTRTPTLTLGSLVGTVAKVTGYFPEEERSKQPSLFSVVRAIRDFFGYE